jgi:ATP-dependent helicase/nuclease subunit A
MSKLSIVRASAGSGKTHKITGEFLKLLYGDTDNFRHILAVTFTNKATEEMKTRIISELHKLGSGKYSDYLEILKKSTGYNERNVRTKSDTILKRILHNYSRFSVSTIDSFFQKIIRSFTREIGIQSGFTIELDTDRVLEEAINRLFLEANNNLPLREWLVSFAINRTEEGRNWNFKKDISDLGKQVFKEEFKEYSDKIAGKLNNKEFLKSYLSDLYKIKNYFENTLSEKGKRGLELISSCSLAIDDFIYKLHGPAGYFDKLARGDFQAPGNRILAALNSPDKWYAKSSTMKGRIEKAVANGLNELMVEVVDFFNNNYSDYLTSKTIRTNIYTLGILSDITGEIFKYTNENNLFLITDASAFLNKVIENNDAPFIYEKTGNYFHHFMIDEFQDTSGFQWNNFKPLIVNSLAQNFNNLIVGDAKQSIYRWRSTNWEILTEKVYSEFFKESINNVTLNLNRRSRRNIIDFNNSFFTRAPEILQNKFNDELSGFMKHPEADKLAGNITNVYHDVWQSSEMPADEGRGYVKIRFLDTMEGSEVKNNLVGILKELQDKGYRLKDIAILTRKKDEGKEIADFLIEYKDSCHGEDKYRFDVISEESLYLSSSCAVRFIIALLRFFINDNDNINNYFIVFEYLNYIKNTANDGTGIIVDDYRSDSYRSLIDKYLPGSFTGSAGYLAGLSLYETVERLVEIFSLGDIKGEIPFIQAFQDMVLEYSGRKSSDIFTFLEYWDNVGFNRSISISEAQDAIRIMTIHKSKGLGFRAVILPYCNWYIDNLQNRPVIWCKPGQSPFNRLDIVPVRYMKELKDTHFAHDYYIEKSRSYIDNLNLLYVAFTRASDALFCIADGRARGSGFSAVSGLLQCLCSGSYDNTQAAKEKGRLLLFGKYYNNEENIFEYGSLDDVSPDDSYKKHEAASIRGYAASDSRKKLRIAYQAGDFFAPDTDIRTSPLNYGKIMHEIFGNIVTTDDIDRAVEKIYIEGKIGLEQKKAIRSDIDKIFADTRIRNWFSGSWKIYNEKEIILPDGPVRRPDRVMLKGSNAVIIDYKFGNVERREYIDQVNEYGLLLKEMGYSGIESYVWYLSTGKIIKA